MLPAIISSRARYRSASRSVLESARVEQSAGFLDARPLVRADAADELLGFALAQIVARAEQAECAAVAQAQRAQSVRLDQAVEPLRADLEDVAFVVIGVVVGAEMTMPQREARIARAGSRPASVAAARALRRRPRAPTIRASVAPAVRPAPVRDRRATRVRTRRPAAAARRRRAQIRAEIRVSRVDHLPMTRGEYRGRRHRRKRPFHGFHFPHRSDRSTRRRHEQSDVRGRAGCMVARGPIRSSRVVRARSDARRRSRNGRATARRSVPSHRAGAA